MYSVGGGGGGVPTNAASGASRAGIGNVACSRLRWRNSSGELPTKGVQPHSMTSNMANQRFIRTSLP